MIRGFPSAAVWKSAVIMLIEMNVWRNNIPALTCASADRMRELASVLCAHSRLLAFELWE